MRLYATIQSERATKGQGGNEYINIDLWVGSSKNPITAGTINFYIDDDNDYVIMYNDFEVYRQAMPPEPTSKKGKQQKDEKCPSGHKQDADGRCPCVNRDAF